MLRLILCCYIAVTDTQLNDKAQYLAQIEKLVQSQTLHGSESLCQLLRYLAKQALEHPGAPIKEYQIATELFARPQDFDIGLDGPRAGWPVAH
jgi:hypothetical protein